MAKTASKSLIELTELVEIVRQHVPKKNLEELNRSSTQEAAVYRVIRDTQGQIGEDDIIRATKLPHRRFQQILTELKERLLPMLYEFELAEPKFSDHARKLYSLNEEYHRVRILERYGAKKSAHSRARLAMESAIKLEEWALALFFSTVLSNLAAHEGDTAEYNSLLADQRRFRLLYEATLDSKEAEDRLYLVFARSADEHPEVLPAIKRAINKLEPIVRKQPTYLLQSQLLRLKGYAMQVKMDFRGALQICDQETELLKEFPQFSSRAQKAKNANIKFGLHIQLRDYEDAWSDLAECEQLYDSESMNWYYLKEWHFRLLMRTENFEDAYKLYLTVTKTKLFSSQSEPVKDKWALFGRYAEFFSGREVLGAKVLLAKPGKLTRELLRFSPSFKRDHAGYQMAALILEILIVLDSRGHRDSLFSRIESLATYKSRHLRGQHHKQSNLFIDLVQLIPQQEFNWPLIERRAGPILSRMTAIREIDSLQAEQMLPYNSLWDRIVTSAQTLL